MEKLYHAIVWVSDPTIPGKRVTIWAESLAKARELLEAEYGKGVVFNLHNEEDAAKKRGEFKKD